MKRLFRFRNIVIVLILAFCVLVIRMSGVMRRYYIPSDSMLPTLRIRDLITVNTLAYSGSEPKVGDIIVFKAPPEALVGIDPTGDVPFVKRVIGVPGDMLSVEPGYVEVNGKKLDRTALRTIFGDMVSAQHVGTYYRFAPIATPDQDAGKVREKMLKLLAAGAGPVRDANSQMMIGQIEAQAEPGAPTVRLAGDSVYVDGRKLSPAELRSRLGEKSKIVIHPGRVIRNGKPLDEPYIAEDPELAYPVSNGSSENPMAEMSASSVTQAVAAHKLTVIREKGKITKVKLAPGQFFMMGDNRNNASDSRFWGPLSRSAIVGRVYSRFWPFERAGVVK